MKTKSIKKTLYLYDYHYNLCHELYSRKDVCDFLGIHKKRLEDYIDTKTLIGTRSLFYVKRHKVNLIYK